MKPSEAYSKGEANRMRYLDRAKDASALTLPTLFPYDGFNSSTAIETPYQSVGSNGVNSLSAKLLMSLLPVNTPFFRLTVDDGKLRELDAQPEAKATVLNIISQMEQSIFKEIELRALRIPIHDAIKHLIVAGNCLMYMPDKGGVRVFPLSQYVVTRDPSGNVDCIVTLEALSEDNVPKDLKSKVESKEKDSKNSYNENCYKLYTMIKRGDDGFTITQEIADEIVDVTEGKPIPEEELPYNALRWSVVNGENYGRGLIEEYLGDLMSIESLSKSIVEGSAAAARIVGMVDPAGVTDPSDINEAPNGTFIPGKINDVGFLRLDKGSDFRVALETVSGITLRLSSAFLLSTAVRQAERVTAEEIRLLANELESSLGGVYAVLSQSLQYPMVVSLMRQLQKTGTIPKIPSALKKYIRPTIITGVSALGRTSEVEKMRTFIALSSQILGPQEVLKRINPNLLLLHLASNIGISLPDLLKSEAQIAEEEKTAREQALQAQLISKGTAPAITAIGNNLDAVQQGLAQQAQ